VSVYVYVFRVCVYLVCVTCWCGVVCECAHVDGDVCPCIKGKDLAIY